MSTVKRTLVNVSFYDPEAIQRKLEQMAAQGWMIQKAGNLFWTYTKIPPQKLRFAVTYFPGASEFDPKPSEKQLEKEELCAQEGIAPEELTARLAGAGYDAATPVMQ